MHPARKRYKKLVRDKIPVIIRANGEEPDVEILTSDERFEDELRVKLIEEMQELLDVPKDAPASTHLGEIVDIREVLDAICRLKKISPQEVEHRQRTKRELSGGFEGRVFLKGVKPAVAVSTRTRVR